MIIADGVLEYLSAEEVKVLLNRITDHFSHGQVAFDVMSEYAMVQVRSKAGKVTSGLQMWAVEEPVEVDRMDPKLRRTATIPLLQSPYLHHLPWVFRRLYTVMALLPRYRNMMRVLRYDF